jgi:hypothetical protein
MFDPQDCPDHQVRCSKLTPEDRLRKCVCLRMATPQVPWVLNETDKRWLRSLHIEASE